jgi:putative peptide zinc metalloprotease protein
LIASVDKPVPLPALREDLRLLQDSPAQSGAPRWLLHDPVRDSFFEIGLEAFQLISLWHRSETVAALAVLASAESGRMVSEEEVSEFARYLYQMRLTTEAAGSWRELSEAAEKQRHGWFNQILHNYLFFKLPLCNPTAFLEKTLPSLRFLASKPMLGLFSALFLCGLYLASRQWNDLTDGLARQLNLSGLMMFAVTLFVMKIFHELGHAYVATAYGCRVRSAGIAVMMMAPMLYTDVTEAWRLPNRRHRMAIDLAGVAVELIIAGLALLIWAFLPPGDGRDIALVVATTAVVMTLAVNLSPFMRFDGYYVFADLIGIKNLQSRAFALVRWRLREILFGLARSAPDTIQGGLRTLVIVYGMLTMIYRFFLFLGIAIFVYQMSFKLLGIALFVVEIGYFILLPLWREMKVWLTLRSDILVSRKAWVSTAGLAVVITALSLPWSTRVTIPAVMEPAQFAKLYPTGPAEIRVNNMTLGQYVTKGDLLLVLSSQRLEKELDVNEAKLQLVEERMGRRLGDAKDQAQSISMEKDRLSLLERKQTLTRQMAQLSVRATMNGRIVEVDPNLHPGRLLSRQDEVGMIIAGNTTTIRGFADQQDLWRIQAGQKGRFIPDDAQSQSVDVTLSEITVSASTSIDIPLLAENHGGKLRIHPVQANQPLMPLDPIHQVNLLPALTSNQKDDNQVTTGSISQKTMRGIVILDAKPQSIVAAFWRRALKVLVQESGA